MKPIKYLFLSMAFLIAVFGLFQLAQADVLDLGISARSRGLGGAYVGDNYDAANGIFGNPGILGFIHTAEVVSMYSDLTGDVATTLFGFSFPFRQGVISLGYAANDSYGIWVASIDATSRLVPDSQLNYLDNMLMLSYGHIFNEKLSLGTRLKYLQQGATGMANAMGHGMNVDLGLLWALNRDANIGLVISNVIGGQLGSIRWDNGTYTNLPIGILTGFEYRTARIHYVADYHYKADLANKLCLGLEYELSSCLQIRAGAEQSALPGQVYTIYTAGLGLMVKNLALDYAYDYDPQLTCNTRQYVSLKFTLPQFNNLPAKVENAAKRI